MNPNEPWSQTVYTVMAAVAGAITALSFRRWQEMTTPEIMLALIVGASFAWYVTPLIAHSVLHVGENEARYISGLTYIFGAGSNALLPFAIRWVKRLFGEGDAK